MAPVCGIHRDEAKYLGQSLGNDIFTERLPEEAPVVTPRVHSCMSIIIRMADNSRILMAKCPFLRLCLQIMFCGTNFNLA